MRIHQKAIHRSLYTQHFVALNSQHKQHFHLVFTYNLLEKGTDHYLCFA